MLNSFTRSTKKLTSVIAILLAMLLVPSIYAQKPFESFWKSVSENSIQRKGERRIVPEKYLTFELNLDGMKNALFQAPKEFSKGGVLKAISLPLPNGQESIFYVEESPIMAPELAQKFPMIKTYIVRGVTSGFSGRIDITTAGFHGMIFTTEGTVFIDPFETSNTNDYIVYYKKDFKKRSLPEVNQSCVIDNPEIRKEIEGIMNSGVLKNATNQLRVYRLALAGTGEYTAFHGGTVTGGLAAMVTTMNRVDAVYEKEVSVRMVLIANNNLLVYTNASTDPYTNNNGSTMLGQNQTNVDNVIGNANYDIGHVFSTGGGGVAYLGVVCRSGNKAGGVTGSSAPVGDPFDIDYVAHEMGHQFSGNHSFNGSTGSCSGGNRNANTAYEPGSGSTIMAYAGICSPQDLQSNSDDYFHIVNYAEIISYTQFSSGNTCPTLIESNNNNPVVTVPAGGFYIPISTPFKLTGSATDADNDPLTYCWEEYDLGPAGAPGTPSGNAPIFRSWEPVSSPTRIFPRLTNLLNNTTVIGEIMPTYTRTLTFRLTARDNKMGGGGLGYSALLFNVTSAAGPFVVTYPNTAVTVPALSTVSVTWNKANTDIAPVSCSSVNILLSTDGGNNFNIVLASNTPNDGTEDVILPNNLTNTARIKVESVGNIFFDISNVNFTITEAVPVELSMFRAADISDGVRLEWETVTETNNRGFHLERSKDNITFEEVGFIPGRGTTTEKSYYSFTDYSVNSGTYSYRLRQEDYDGTSSNSNIVEVELGSPKEFALLQNHPNPFNPSTRIAYTLDKKSDVVLKVFDVLGKEVKVLVNESQEAGSHQVEFNASELPSGLYFYQISSGNRSITKKMMLLK